MRTVTIHTDWISLAALLKLSGLAASGGQAKLLVLSQKVSVEGYMETRRARKILPGQTVGVEGNDKVLVVREGS